MDRIGQRRDRVYFQFLQRGNRRLPRKKRARQAAEAEIPKTFMSRHNLLLLALVSMWRNPTKLQLSDLFNTAPTTIHDTRSRLFPLLYQCLQRFIKVPSHPTPRIDAEPLKGTFLIIDSTPTPIPKPKLQTDRKLYYNFKKRPSAFAMKTQVAVGLDLTIWDVSATYPHSVHDLQVLHGSIVPSLLTEEKKALGDSAYQGEPNFVVPFKKPRGRELKRSQKLFNKQLSHVRVAVENVFKRVKDFHIVSDIYREDYHNLGNFNIIFKLVCALVNIHFQKHPLRRTPTKLKNFRQIQ